jgi:hypothetical protein
MKKQIKIAIDQAESLGLSFEYKYRRDDLRQIAQEIYKRSFQAGVDISDYERDNPDYSIYKNFAWIYNKSVLPLLTDIVDDNDRKEAALVLVSYLSHCGWMDGIESV